MRKPTKQRERTFKVVNLEDFDEERSIGYFKIPTLEQCEKIPDEMIGFNYVKTAKEDDFQKCVHFFLDDYQFERIWNRPHEVIPRLLKFDCTLTPDFSLYTDMPIAMQIWNTYRNRLIGQMMQDYGIDVIPTVSWSVKESYEFCFDGLPTRGTIAVSTVGVMKSKEEQKLWRDGMEECIKAVNPKTILIYGKEIDFDFGNTYVRHYQARRNG